MPRKRIKPHVGNNGKILVKAAKPLGHIANGVRIAAAGQPVTRASRPKIPALPAVGKRPRKQAHQGCMLAGSIRPYTRPVMRPSAILAVRPFSASTFCLALAVGNMRITTSFAAMPPLICLPQNGYGHALAHDIFRSLPPGCATGKQGPYALHSRFDRFWREFGGRGNEADPAEEERSLCRAPRQLSHAYTAKPCPADPAKV